MGSPTQSVSQSDTPSPYYFGTNWGGGVARGNYGLVMFTEWVIIVCKGSSIIECLENFKFKH